MSGNAVVRRLLCVLASLVLLALGGWTLMGGVRNLHQAGTVGQQVETVVQLACGLLCAAVVLTRFLRRPMHRPIRIAWVLTQVAWVSLSALVWGPPMLHIALLFAIVTLLLAWAILWALGPAFAT